MTDLKIDLNAYAVIQRKKLWDGNYSWQTINMLMIPEKQRAHFFVDSDTLDLEQKIIHGLQSIDFLPVITITKTHGFSKDIHVKNPMEKLADLLISLYTELQDVKANSDEELLDLLDFMDSELVDAAKIVAQLKKLTKEDLSDD